MNRALHVINFVGILLLATLCATQWVVNRTLNLAKIAAESHGINLEQQVKEKSQTITGNIADLEGFRAQLQRALDANTAAEAQIKILTADRDSAMAQRDRLQTAIDGLNVTLEKWKAAVAQRDEALKQAAQTAAQLAHDRNDAIATYNDLATKFNAEVDQLNQANQTIQKLTAERNDAILKFNDLATRYNELAKGLATTGPATTPRPEKELP